MYKPEGMYYFKIYEFLVDHYNCNFVSFDTPRGSSTVFEFLIVTWECLSDSSVCGTNIY